MHVQLPDILVCAAVDDQPVPRLHAEFMHQLLSNGNHVAQ
jgi:hypothetical protein